MLLHGDCLEQLKALPDNSVDSVVTDPPYGLSFMGKAWDYDVPKVEVWREVLRVLKPGGHLLSFFGTRTYHRGAVAIEDAGFEIRDQLQWVYGSGFPKSLDVSKAIDKAAGAEREVIGDNPNNRDRSKHTYNSVDNVGSEAKITAPATPEAKQWQGWGTALKPANEPIVLARKPLEGTVAANVLKHGCGGINVDRCRIGETVETWPKSRSYAPGQLQPGGKGVKQETGAIPSGRFPSNLLLDEVAAEMLDAQVGFLHGAGNKKTGDNFKADGSMFGIGTNNGPTKLYDRGGSASRFFYVAKASKGERNAGLEGMPEVEKRSAGGTTSSGKPTMEGRDRFGCMTQNHHPTVKPIRLMTYLVRLVTPPGGVCLDPFMGSGTTGVACAKEGFDFIGIEREAEYLEIAKRRIEAAKPMEACA